MSKVKENKANCRESFASFEKHLEKAMCFWYNIEKSSLGDYYLWISYRYLQE